MNPYILAHRFLGLKEQPGPGSNIHVLAMLQFCDKSVQDDETPWCSAFVNYIAWLAGRQRSGSLAARSWLKIGMPIDAQAAQQGDVVVLQRGAGAQPDATVLAAPGHVGFFAGWDGDSVLVLGGNQGNAVTIAPFPKSRVLGIRRIA